MLDPGEKGERKRSQHGRQGLQEAAPWFSQPGIQPGAQLGLQDVLTEVRFQNRVPFCTVHF